MSQLNNPIKYGKQYTLSNIPVGSVLSSSSAAISVNGTGVVTVSADVVAPKEVFVYVDGSDGFRIATYEFTVVPVSLDISAHLDNSGNLVHQHVDLSSLADVPLVVQNASLPQGASISLSQLGSSLVVTLSGFSGRTPTTLTPAGHAWFRLYIVDRTQLEAGNLSPDVIAVTSPMNWNDATYTPAPPFPYPSQTNFLNNPNIEVRASDSFSWSINNFSAKLNS
jgi:hypothetical protein